jgi:hypothetical protein
LPGLFAPARVEGDRGAANDVLGGFFHIADIRTKQRDRGSAIIYTLSVIPGSMLRIAPE